MNSTIEELVAKYGTCEPFELAEKMDINIYFRPLVDVGGYYMKLKNNIKLIVINNTMPHYQQKFVMAHEIGHALLHPEKYALMLRNSLYVTNRLEVEADKFAIELLLSDSMVYDNPDRTIDDWASIFGLPREIIELKFRG